MITNPYERSVSKTSRPHRVRAKKQESLAMTVSGSRKNDDNERRRRREGQRPRGWVPFHRRHYITQAYGRAHAHQREHVRAADRS
jgi:hypothetical protein